MVTQVSWSSPSSSTPAPVRLKVKTQVLSEDDESTSKRLQKRVLGTLTSGYILLFRAVLQNPSPPLYDAAYLHVGRR